MKTITYLGVEYSVPDWVKFVIADADGKLYGYRDKPIRHESSGIYRSSNRGDDRGVEFIADIGLNYPLAEV